MQVSGEICKITARTLPLCDEEETSPTSRLTVFAQLPVNSSAVNVERKDWLLEAALKETR